VAEEVAWQDNWESLLGTGGETVDMLLTSKRPLVAHAMLRPFFEAYEIVADVLRDAPADISEKDLTKRALGVGRQYAAQGRVRSNESVSALLFATARQVAADQHLLEAGPDVGERRAAFCNELLEILSDLKHIDELSRRNS
jgi:glycerol-3-phosphate O-acyltransferase